MTDSSQIDLFFRYKVTNEERFQFYLDHALPTTQTESYVLEYHLFRDADGTVFQHERYQDEAAIGKHMETTADAQAAHAEAVEYIDFRAVGNLSDEFRAQIEGLNLNATYWHRFRSVGR